MCQTEPPRVIDLTARLRRARRRERAYILLALWTQYLSLGVLALYGILRAVVCRGAPLGTYCGPQALMLPLSNCLLLFSWITDQHRREKWA